MANKYIKIHGMLPQIQFDNNLNFTVTTTISSLCLSYPESIEDDVVKEYIKQSCKDCRTYAFEWISQQEFEAQKRKHKPVLELDKDFKIITEDNNL